jgi:hypothetical protein
MADTYTAENVKKLTQQILAQGTTSKWTGGLDPQKAASYMADDLAKSGITDISQVGRGENGIVNKLTGQQLVSGYGDRTSGNLWSGSYEGKGNTGFGVQFDAKGNPVFYTQGASSNDLVNMLGDNKLLNAAAQLGAAYFGGPAGTAALNAAMGKDVGDIAKSAFLSYLGGQAGNAVSGMEGVQDILGKTGTDIASKAASSFVTNQGKFDLEKFLLSQGLSAGKQALTSGFDGWNVNPKDFTEGYFTPGGEGWSDPIARTAGVTGSGYYDEITGQYVKDALGGLRNPLGYETGNIDPNLEWEYNQTSPNVWTDKNGNVLDMSYLPNSQTALTGDEIMKSAGALPGGSSGGSGGGSKTTTPAAAGLDLSKLLPLLAADGQPTSVAPVQDPYAHIKLMENLFGDDISYKLASLEADKGKQNA